ncbi:MAG TPA: hypothetical protein ENN67_07990, partial [Firmicutes bacterium]|nr:hypothetical protein [Bacillota bacterium]
KIVDVPFVREDELTEFDILYTRAQIEELVPVCEELTGKKFDIDRLKEILNLSKEAIGLWNKLLSMGKKRPSPFDCYFDASHYMAPMTVFRGTRECVDFYSQAVDEMEKRAEQRFSPAGRERFRLFFEGAPPWPNISEFREMFMEWGGVGVAATYPRVVSAIKPEELDTDDPFELLTLLASSSYLNWNLSKRKRYIENTAKEYKVDGIVFHSVRSCRPFSIGQVDIRNYIAREVGIPTLFVDSDVADPRYFSSAQIKNRIETFLEVLDRRKHNGSSGA